jgi:hypothetical protein
LEPMDSSAQAGCGCRVPSRGGWTRASAHVVASLLGIVLWSRRRRRAAQP